MPLAGPITLSSDEIAALVRGTGLFVTAVAATIAAALGGISGSRRGAAVSVAVKAFAAVAIVGVGLSMIAGAVAGSANDAAPGPSTTAPAPAPRYSDHLTFSGDRAAADQVMADIRTALEPLAQASLTPTTEQLRTALATVATPDGPLVVVTDTGEVQGPTFVAEAAGGCLTGSVEAGLVSIEIDGYLNDGGCVALIGH